MDEGPREMEVGDAEGAVVGELLSGVWACEVMQGVRQLSSDTRKTG